MTDQQDRRPFLPREARDEGTSRFSKTFLFVVLLLVSFLFFRMVSLFVVPILLAAVFTALFYPLYRWLAATTRGRRRLSALLCCVILLVGVLTPFYVVGRLVARQVSGVYHDVLGKLQELVRDGGNTQIDDIQASRLYQLLGLEDRDWQATAQDLLTSLAGLAGKVINKTYQGTFQIVTTLFITLFTMYYFFRDGDALVRRIKYLSPLSDVYEDAIIERFVRVSRASLMGTLIIGVVQGSIGAVTLWACGIEAAAIWGVVMIVLAIIPVVGAWLVMYPAGIIQIVTGNIAEGVVILLVTTFVISSVDNLLRPRLVGHGAGMHDLMIFFSTLGGLSMFGVMGFIIGPVVATFFLSILEIYGIEFKRQLELAQSIVPASPLTKVELEARPPAEEHGRLP